jgi:hypothetical protein
MEDAHVSMRTSRVKRAWGISFTSTAVTWRNIFRLMTIFRRDDLRTVRIEFCLRLRIRVLCCHTVDVDLVLLHQLSQVA